MLDYGLLGPTQVGVDGQFVPVGGRRQRALLTILLLGGNQPVSRDALVDRLWGEHPPAGAQHALEVYVSRLRKVLEPRAGDRVLLAQPGAYLLRVPPERIDMCRFERLDGFRFRAVVQKMNYAARRMVELQMRLPG